MNNNFRIRKKTSVAVLAILAITGLALADKLGGGAATSIGLIASAFVGAQGYVDGKNDAG